MLLADNAQDTESGQLKALRPIGTAEFVLAPRQLPPVKSIEMRVDSSLRASGAQVECEKYCLPAIWQSRPGAEFQRMPPVQQGEQAVSMVRHVCEALSQAAFSGCQACEKNQFTCQLQPGLLSPATFLIEIVPCKPNLCASLMPVAGRGTENGPGGGAGGSRSQQGEGGLSSWWLAD